MSYFEAKDIVYTNRLFETFGSYVELTGEDGDGEVYRILKEFQLGTQGYAVLQSEAMSKEGEVEFFRITISQDGHPELETIEDDEEWENVAELFDELNLPDAMDEP
ncbi:MULTISPECIES: DUF1292 domain-containing protein [unclassified Paenibacillus]|uniref:DUF1292 domain-containing protein n=1 Tax=unclassified Paenibacillus TaxID=185978 RepID=UPI001C0F569D|nr:MULTISPECIES: DUF1292 domain-containing protein [unclassified Paenibacillus]MBU5442604.1 DUF1292 domain-containing protein [Paenibacillus sp. MSJ-34]CAH0119058.1 hypothetical protein PAE9249_01555 [Paenibacillus sp. CECT 9249]